MEDIKYNELSKEEQESFRKSIRDKYIAEREKEGVKLPGYYYGKDNYGKKENKYERFWGVFIMIICTLVFGIIIYYIGWPIIKFIFGLIFSPFWLLSDGSFLGEYGTSPTIGDFVFAATISFIIAIYIIGVFCSIFRK